MRYCVYVTKIYLSNLKVLQNFKVLFGEISFRFLFCLTVGRRINIKILRQKLMDRKIKPLPTFQKIASTI